VKKKHPVKKSGPVLQRMAWFVGLAVWQLSKPAHYYFQILLKAWKVLHWLCSGFDYKGLALLPVADRAFFLPAC
jgi:hypothetical protein